MRYADGPSVHEEIHIEAAPSDVWRLVTDIALPARLSPELQRTEWLDGATEPVPGARFAGYNRHPVAGMEWRTVSRVAVLEPEQRFAWEVIDPDGRYGEEPTDTARPLATWTFELRAVDGGTVLSHSGRVGPARSGLNLAIDREPEREEEIIQARLGDLRTGIRATLEGVKHLAEERA
ncbi:SRPBCC family protein [Streptomyces cinnamoneus]|uniref:SRPBCC family protein n=1 Tax=Streptomyces cinnamoneus TaxID=53446 RepID=UPI0033EE8643